MAWQSGAVGRLRGFSSPDVPLRTVMLHVVRVTGLSRKVTFFI